MQRNRSYLLITAASFAIASAPASAQILLDTENFNFPSGTGSTASDVLNTAYGTTSANELTNGWAAFSGSTATVVSSTVATVAISDRQSPNGVTSGANQYGFLVIAPATGSYLVATAPTTLSINTADPGLKFTWEEGNSLATDSTRLAIEIGSQWYASSGTFSTSAQTAGSFGASPGSTGTAESLTFSATASNWKLVSFTPGTTLALGATPSSDLSGSIDGLGFFSAVAAGGNERLDTLQVSATSLAAAPEPSTDCLMLGGVLALGLVARSRFRSRTTS